MRMHPNSFELLHRLVKSEIIPIHHTRSAIGSEHRLVITLMYMFFYHFTIFLVAMEFKFDVYTFLGIWLMELTSHFYR